MSTLPITLGAFALILLLSRLRVPLGAAILAGSIALGMALGLDLAGVLRAIWIGATSPNALALALMTLLLLGLSALMRESGRLDDIVSLAQAVLRRPSAAMIAMPALIGLLPMPGGAVFSAPMVESAGGGANVSPGFLSYINYWFRHIWEYFWPLYPGVILAMALTGLDIPSWTALMFFATISMFLGGLLVMRGMNPDLHVKSAPPQSGTKRRLVRATSPIWIILVIWGVARLLLDLLDGSGAHANIPAGLLRQAPLICGLLGSIAWTCRTGRLGWRRLGQAFLHPTTGSLTGLVFAIMVFQRMLEEVGAPVQIARELEALHVPIALVAGILPFIGGFVTGIAVGFVGTAMPIVLNLVNTPDSGRLMIAYIPLAYTFGHLGQMLSPLHVCQIVSNRYFGTTYGPVYRYLVPSSLATALLNIGYFFLLRWFY